MTAPKTDAKTLWQKEKLLIISNLPQGFQMLTVANDSDCFCMWKRGLLNTKKEMVTFGQFYLFQECLNTGPICSSVLQKKKLLTMNNFSFCPNDFYFTLVNNPAAFIDIDFQYLLLDVWKGLNLHSKDKCFQHLLMIRFWQNGDKLVANWLIGV